MIRRKKKNNQSNQYQEDWLFYIEEVWNKRPHTCEVTGKWLGHEPKITFFHHILPKSKYPQFRHESWNIALIHPEIHNQFEMYPEKVPKLKLRTEELLKLIEDEEDRINEQKGNS